VVFLKKKKKLKILKTGIRNHNINHRLNGPKKEKGKANLNREIQRVKRNEKGKIEKARNLTEFLPFCDLGDERKLRNL
jgi:hypothetical protein